MLAQLIPVDGGAPIELTRDITVVGRKTGVCDLVIDRGSVSKMHCLIVKTDGLLFIRDLGSTNGTKVNGQRITRGALLPGDELAFAGSRYKVHLGPCRTSTPADRAVTEMMAIPEPLLLSGLHQEAAVDDPRDVDEIGEDSAEFDAEDLPLENRAVPFADPEDSDSDVRLLPDESAV